MATSPISSGIACPEYEAMEMTKRCRYFNDDRSCQLTAHPVCEEWLRSNPEKTIPNPSSATFVESNPDYKIAVVEGLHFRPGWKAKMLERLTDFPPPVRATPSTTNEQSAQAPKPTPPPSPAVVAVGKQAPFTVEGVPSEIEVASFRALGVEVCITNDTVGELWLVPKYTDAKRKEITPEHLLTLCRLIAAFPGCSVSKFIKTYVEA